jgi:hypothetical protein
MSILGYQWALKPPNNTPNPEFVNTVKDPQDQVINMVNAFFFTKRTSIPSIKVYRDGFQT